MTTGPAHLRLHISSLQLPALWRRGVAWLTYSMLAAVCCPKKIATETISFYRSLVPVR